MEDIEPSCGVLDFVSDGTVQRRFVVDCGAVSVREDGTERVVTADLSPLRDGRKVDAVLLTHAHMDHMGGLAALAPHLSRQARILMTRPTMRSVRHIIETELRGRTSWANRPYSQASAHETLRRLDAIERPGVISVLGTDILVWPSGHIGGACSFTFRLGGKTVLYSGDRCDSDQTPVLGPTPMPYNWTPDIIAGSDCTYGASDEEPPNWDSELSRLVNLCRERVTASRTVMVYGFSLHRAGIVAAVLDRAGIAAEYPVYLDGAAAVARAKMMTEPEHLWCDRDRLVRFDDVRIIQDRRDRTDAMRAPGGKIVIATSGMGGPGSGVPWRPTVFPDEGATVIFTGYVADDSDGAKVLKAFAEQQPGKPARLTLAETDHMGKPHEVKYALACDVQRVRLGGHNGPKGTLQWFRDMNAGVNVVSHGCVPALTRVAETLASEGMTVVRADQQPVVEIEL